MNTKINSLQQVLALREGDVLKKYPTQGLPESFLEDTQHDNTEEFSLRTIDKKRSMLELVMTEATRARFPSPGAIARQFISNKDLVTQNIWWLSR